MEDLFLDSKLRRGDANVGKRQLISKQPRVKTVNGPFAFPTAWQNTYTAYTSPRHLRELRFKLLYVPYRMIWEYFRSSFTAIGLGM